MLTDAFKRLVRMIDNADTTNVGQLEVILKYGENFCKMYCGATVLVFSAQTRLNDIREILGVKKW